jgi:putative PIN family toxin of toxin-antitoxin system
LKPYRVVFDTNILISAFIFGGNPERIFEEARTSGIRLLTSSSILREFASILQGKFEWNSPDVVEALSAIAYSSELIEPSIRLHIIKDDPDNRILECAVEGDADFIVSGDSHLLTLKKHDNIRIVNSKQLLELIEERQRD